MFDVQARVELLHLYGRQSHLIDNGRASDWAETFTRDGVFDSPSYARPVVGTGALVEFAERFYATAVRAREVHRHVITNIDVAEVGDGTATVICYLQIVATPVGGETRIVRFTTVTDALIHDGSQWLVARRKVDRDDA